MLTSNEIRTVSFDRTIRGYRCEDVEAFLQQVADQFDQQQATMADLEKKLHILAQKIEEYRADEDTLKTALLNAQRMGENVIHEAKQKADSILREATLKSESLNEQAKAQVLEQQMELAHSARLAFGQIQSRLPSRAARPVRSMSLSLEQDLRRLSAAYFLIAGRRYRPTSQPAPLPVPYQLALRELYGQSRVRAAAHRAAAQAVSDPCVCQLLTDLGDEAEEHSHRIRGILEAM